MADLDQQELNNKEFNEVLYRVKHILGTVPKYIKGSAFILCFIADHRNYKGDFVNDTVNVLVVQYHNRNKPKFNWNWD